MTVIAAAAAVETSLYALIVHGAGTAFSWLAAWAIGITAAWAAVIAVSIGWRIFRVAATGLLVTAAIAAVGLIALVLAMAATGVGSAAVNGAANFLIEWVAGTEVPAAADRPAPSRAPAPRTTPRRTRRRRTPIGQSPRIIGRKEQIAPTTRRTT